MTKKINLKWLLTTKTAFRKSQWCAKEVSVKDAIAQVNNFLADSLLYLGAMVAVMMFIQTLSSTKESAEL